MKIQVTAEHIERGQVNDCKYCPIALALREINEGLRVGTHTIWHVRNPERTVLLPPEAQAFVSEFDSYVVPPPPFSFEVNLSPLLIAQ